MSWGVIGHEREVAVLATALAAGRLPQSLLITGPRQVGKRTLALAIARAANCANGEPPCNSCRICRLVSSGGYPDLHLIQLREGRQKIGIREVQELQLGLARRPAEGKWRVALITDAERLSPEAENCLLKTLEEPPPYGLIMITAGEAEALLPTTISRCSRIRLRAVQTREIATHLTDSLGVAAEQASLLASLSDGRPGWALAGASEPGRFAAYQTALDRLRRASDRSRLVRLEVSRELAESWSSKSELIREELRIWTTWWRDVLILKLNLASRVLHVDQESDLRQHAERHSLSEVRTAVANLVQARTDLDQNVNPRLALDMAVLRLPARSQ